MAYTQEELDLITLCSFGELNYKQKFTLLHGLKSHSPDFDEYKEILIKTVADGVYNKVKGKFYSQSYRDSVLGSLSKRNIICVTYFSQNYPEQLKNIPCPPIVLFCKGNVKLLAERLFAVVGSRRTSPAYLKECKKISGELTANFTLVTGMADGGDSAAVEGAIKSGKIISVLAYGFDHAYPSVNKSLIDEVAKHGLLVSEYTPQVAPVNYNFPVRNRIIAGLCEGVLVVSAGKKSGALITADYALEYNRRVFAFPYALGVSSGEGCNALIKDGAILTQSAQDVFEDFNINYSPPQKLELSDEESKIFELIKNTGEAFAADIAAKMGKLPFQIIPALSALEIKGLIVRLGGNRYSAVNN